ncbi:hypothetical protein U9M48_002366, partial [Paspalum notatum var. saurae]
RGYGRGSGGGGLALAQSLLGRLASVLLDETQLLGGLRGDVEFIKDEMEAMHGLLRHLTDAQHRNHLVRAWMKQVAAGLARDCECNVELYLHRVGGGGADPGAAGNSANRLLHHLRRLLRPLRSVPARHRIATQIRELKVRARDVGDRRKRYGITVPDLPAAGGGGDDALSSPLEAVTGDDEEDLRKLAVLFDDHGDDFPADGEVVGESTDFLMNWLSSSENGEPPQPHVRIFSIIGAQWADEVANVVYKHPRVATLFDCKAWCFVSRRRRTDDVRNALGQIMEEIAGVRPTTHMDEDEVTQEKSVISELQGHLQGKRFLIVVVTDDRFVGYQDYYWKPIVDALLHAAEGCHPGSAIIIILGDTEMARSSSPYKTINAAPTYMHEFLAKKAKQSALIRLCDDIFRLCKPNAFAMKTFLHLLYISPSMSGDQLAECRNPISECKRIKRSISRLLLMRCYNELPSKYRTCLLYLTIFPQGHAIRTTSLARRWIAEGLVTTTVSATSSDDRIIQSATDEADHYLEVLFIAGFVSPLEINAASRFTVHHQVREFIARLAGEVGFVDATRPTDFAHHLSIHSRIGLQKSHSDSDSKGIVASLPSLSGSPQWQLLKYLSLRNTDILQLPKQIKDLHCLETLDIRQTQVRMLANKAIVLPQLKHFLAGHNISGSIARTRIPERLCSAVEIALDIQKMENMEILSHVHVSNSDVQLSAISRLLKLRKLGVSLRSEKLEDLFTPNCREFEYMLPIWARKPGHTIDNNRCSTPIERLSICGITSGLVYSIKDHHQLTKITLSETFLGENDICILGKISKLRGLRLLHNSYTAASKLSFKAEEFQHLRSLVVDSSNITNISFDNGAAPSLEMIVWSFSTMEALSGLRNLSRLMKLELNESMPIRWNRCTGSLVLISSL